ncbi:MAG: RHS repeat-associated core domain-containing protein, partial [Anaerolineaceae bacterium]|nr:RHS repeat-associated core domain-containing protein [Anaerolineaceae bacterium]
IGGITVAVDTGGTLQWVLSDHLGSASVTANADGTWNSEIQYTAFGEVRASSGLTSTGYRYTGQLDQPEVGLYFYEARFYDPYLNHFSQPDIVVPDPYNPMDWNRYNYTRYSPVTYIDPSGNFIVPPPIIWPFIPVIGAYYFSVSVGNLPDMRGIYIAQKEMDKYSDSIETAAGIAVQAEFSGWIDNIIGDITPGSSGYGIAQTNITEIEKLGLENLDPKEPEDALIVMQTRIESACKACENCTGEDLIIVASLAQNNMISTDDIKYMSREANGEGINWRQYLGKESSSAGQIDAQIRTEISGMNYKQLMLKKFILDMRALRWLGWDLPQGITPSSLDDLENLTR